MKQDTVLMLVLQVAVLCSGHSPQQNVKRNSSHTPLDHRFFLHEIFSKYGHNGVMSYEGFEHLLANLGLGRLAFNKEHSVALHRVNGSFQEVHDQLELHDHHHEEYDQLTRDRRSVSHDEGDVESELERLAREHREDDTLSVKPATPPRRCLSPQDMLVMFGLEPHHSVMISQLRFLHMCPVIVYELDQRSCYGEHLEGDEESINESPWMQATISVSLISVVGLLGVLLVPMVQKSFYQHLLNFLVGLAVGTLCGDALLHLLPHALVSHGSYDDHNIIVLRAGVAFLTLIMFYFLEKVIHHFRSSKDGTEEFETNTKLSTGTSQSEGRDEESNKEKETGIMLESSHGHSHDIAKAKANTVSSLAWMVIMGDGLHNLTDGLAIGAAFSGDAVAGFATAMAVFCHELPHELGDFAILIKSGLSVRRALYYNIVSSVLSFIGMGFGVWLGKIGAASLWIYAATAGTFLYIALTDLIPEMNQYSKQSKSLLAVVLPMAGMITGGAIMLVIALYEHSLQSLFS